MDIREWIMQTYKPSRLEMLNTELPNYSEIVIQSHEERFSRTGRTVISRHESRTGRAEWFLRDPAV